jgi:FkbM family methyltransferase
MISNTINVFLSKAKRAVVARKLFDNWLLVIAKLLLSKLGIVSSIRVKIGSCVYDVDPGVLERLLSRVSRKYIDVRSLECVQGKLYINGIEVNSINDLIHSVELQAQINGQRYDASLMCWIRNGVKFKHMYGSILEVFNEELYKILRVAGRVVIDVGAFVGDSAIYFALRGARRVIAIEPHPEAFREMVENIRLNKLEEIIIPINAGLASRPREICVEDVDIAKTAVTYHKPGRCTMLVPAITLADVMERYVIDHNTVLKMDCEGCEFDIILNDYEHIKVFKELVFEYHQYVSSDLYQKLLKVLARDYLCKIIREGSETGIVYCIRRSR